MMDIINSKGVHVGVVVGREIFDVHGKKLYDLKGANIYRITGELVGHLTDPDRQHKRLDKASDRLFT
jgi:sporulation protein YlmC with PRC-barrel domain